MQVYPENSEKEVQWEMPVLPDIKVHSNVALFLIMRFWQMNTPINEMSIEGTNKMLKFKWEFSLLSQ